MLNPPAARDRRACRRVALLQRHRSTAPVPAVVVRRAARVDAGGCGKSVVQAHSGEAMYVDRPVALLADVDTLEASLDARWSMAHVSGCGASAGLLCLPSLYAVYV